MSNISVSLPSDGDTIDVADYNTPITTIVSEINGALDNSNISSSAAIAGSKLASSSVPAGKIDFGGAGVGVWWEEIGRTTLTVAADSITVSSIPARKYLKVVALLIPTGGTIDHGFRFNTDSGNNYVYRRSVNGGADAGGTSQAYFYMDAAAAVSTPFLAEVELYNASAQEKVGYGSVVGGGTAGAGNTTNKVEYSNKWANTSAQISTISSHNVTGTGDFAIGSEIIVLGHI